MSMVITASDGSHWHVRRICPPVPARCFDWSASLDGWEDDPSCTVYSTTHAGLVEEIETWLGERT